MKRPYDVKKEVVIMFKKSQAALEFLTTYVWAFMTLLITIGALYYVGIFDFSKFLPQKCTFPLQFECLDFTSEGAPAYGGTDDIIKFKLVNNIGEEILVTSLEVTNDAESPLRCSILSIDCEGQSKTIFFAWTESLECDFTFDHCQDGVFMTDERIEAKITMKYCATATTGCDDSCDPQSGCPEHTINGRIIAVVSPP